jgi:hypothetical protein
LLAPVTSATPAGVVARRMSFRNIFGSMAQCVYAAQRRWSGPMRRRDFAFFAGSGFLAASDAAADPIATTLRGVKPGGRVYFVNGNAHHTAAGAPFDKNGKTTKPWWDISSVGQSIVTFHKGGSGTCVGRTTCKITSVHDETQKHDLGSLLAIEIAQWSYEFSYELTKANKISLVVKPGTWHGRVVGGRRVGKIYDVSVHPGSPKKPFVEGFFSKDFTGLQLITSDPASVIVTEKDGGPVEYGQKLVSLYGVLMR